MYIIAMRRTQIYIDDELDDALRQVATGQGRSAAAIIWDAVCAYLRASGAIEQDDPFRSIIGAYSGGPTDAAENHDYYLYQKDSEREQDA